MTFKPWRVLHLQIDGELPDLAASDGSGGVFVVFWCGSRPLGQVELDSTRLPIPGTALRELGVSAVGAAVAGYMDDLGAMATERGALDGPLARVRKTWNDQSSVASNRTVSVVVCTRDRPTALRACLDSLLACDPTAAEIVVVDNAPRTDDTRRLLDEYPTVRYVLEPKAGLSAARNRGIAVSRGDIIAFTDDDVIVTPEWVERVLAAFTAPDVLCMTGLVLPAELRTESQWVFEKEFGGFGQGYQPIVFDGAFFKQWQRVGAPVWRIGAGANMAVDRRAFELVGVYDERLGAGAAGCSEDSEFWYRVLAAGGICRYDPQAVVHHVHREDLDGLRNQMRAYMRGHVAALLVQWSRHSHRGNLHRLFLTIPGHYGKHALYRLFPSLGRPTRTMLPEMAGCAAGVFYYLRTRSAADSTRLQERYE